MVFPARISPELQPDIFAMQQWKKAWAMHLTSYYFKVSHVPGSFMTWPGRL